MKITVTDKIEDASVFASWADVGFVRDNINKTYMQFEILYAEVGCRIRLHVGNVTIGYLIEVSK